ncbi:MAG: PDZ domain-containing protein [Gammaproteobacteria bacterium]|nr:PDZ domain-containing protein [Gammaproteobacteria bacterium]
MKRWTIPLVCVFAAVTVSAETPQADESVEDRLEKAREMLDQAAGKFAEHVNEYVGEFDVKAWSDRPFLGIVIATQDEEGVRVASVTPGGGAEDAGIRPEDLVIRVNSARLTGSQTPIVLLHEALDRVGKDETVEVELLRDGETMTVDVAPQMGMIRAHVLNTQPIPFTSFASPSNIWSGWNERRHEQAFGFRLVDIGETLGAYFGVDSGVLVLTAEDGSSLLPGDIVQRVGEDDVADAEGAYMAVAEAEEPVKVVVRRNAKRKTLTIEPIEGVKVRKSIEFTGKAGG